MNDKLKEILKNPYIEKYKLFILPVVSLLGGVLLIGFFIYPQFMNFLQTQEEIQKIKTKNAFYQQKINMLSQIDQEEYKSYFDASLVAIPIDKDVSGALRNLQAILLATKLQLDGFSFSNAQNNASSTEFLIKIDVSGDIEGVRSFIEQIKSSPRILVINAIDVVGSGRNKVQASITLTAFYSPLQPPDDYLEKELPVISESEKDLLVKLRGSVGVSSDTVLQGAKGKSDPFQ